MKIRHRPSALTDHLADMRTFMPREHRRLLEEIERMPSPRDMAEKDVYNVAGDIDGDGVLDLAVANMESDDVSVLLGAGDGTFGEGVSHGAGDGPRSVALGDVNGDATPDLAVANFDGNDISILLGR